MSPLQMTGKPTEHAVWLKEENHRRLSSNCFTSNKWLPTADDHQSSVDDTHAARWLRWSEFNDVSLPISGVRYVNEKRRKTKSRSKREGTEHEGPILISLGTAN